jgi:hypothetical protein
MQDQVALGAQRSPTPVKGGIARALGAQKCGDGQAVQGMVWQGEAIPPKEKSKA